MSIEMNAQYRAKQQFAYAIGKKVVEEVREMNGVSFNQGTIDTAYTIIKVLEAVFPRLRRIWIEPTVVGTYLVKDGEETKFKCSTLAQACAQLSTYLQKMELE